MRINYKRVSQNDEAGYQQ